MTKTITTEFFLFFFPREVTLDAFVFSFVFGKLFRFSWPACCFIYLSCAPFCVISKK